MTWDMPGTSQPTRSTGRTLERAGCPSTTWFFAEGSTVLGFDLFYLLQNPQTTVDPCDGPLPDAGRARSSRGPTTCAPGSRTTIYVNAGPRARRDRRRPATSRPTRRSSWSGPCTGACPDSRSCSGTGAMGVTAAATRWFLAEGATGPFFDLYVLIANPGRLGRDVDVQFARPDGTVGDAPVHGARQQPVQRLRGRDRRPREHGGGDHGHVHQQRADRGRAGDVLAGRLLRLLRGPRVGAARRRRAVGGRRRRAEGRSHSRPSC